MNLRRNTYFLVGLGFSMFLAFVLLRNFLLTSGLPEHGDLQFHIDVNVYRVPYSWSYLQSIPSVVWPGVITLWLSWLCPNSEVFARAIYFLSFTLISYNMFIVTFTLARKRANELSCYVASFLASILYTLSLVALGSINWFEELYAYAFIPLLFYFTFKAANAESLTETIKYSLICSLTFIPIFVNPYYALVGGVLFISLLVIELLLNLRRRGFLKSLLHSVIAFSIVSVFALLLNAFIILPAFKLGGTPLPWSPLQLYQLYQPGRANISMFDAFRLWKWSVESPFSPNLMQISTLILPFIAWSSTLLLKDKKMSISLALLSIISLFLAKGVNDPFSDTYIWLVFNTPLNLFKRSDIWLAPLSLSYSLLSSLLIAENLKLNLHKLRNSSLSLFHRFPSLSLNLQSRRNKLAVIIMLILILSTPIATQELLTGDATGLLAPAPIPNAYHKVNNWLSKQSEEFRTLWLPVHGDLEWMPNPHGVTEQPVGHWASSRPVLTNFNPHQRAFADVVTKNLGVNEAFEELSGLFSVKYVILHDDTANVDELKELRDRIQNTSLIETYSEDSLHVFYNPKFQPHIRAIQHPIVLIVGGGLDFLSSYKNFPGFNLPKSAVVFAEQQLGVGAKILDHLTKDDIILTYKGFNDLLFSSINPEYIYAPLDYLKQNPSWHAETRMELYSELDYGKGVIFSYTKGEAFHMTVRVNATTKYQIWIRVYRGDTPGKLSLSVDEKKIGTIEIPPVSEQKFDWIKYGESNLTRGEHKLMIINEEGDFTLNLVALVPTNEFEKTTQWVTNQISASQINIIPISALSDERALSNLHNILSDKFSDVGEPSAVINFKRINSGANGDEWIATINASKPFILAFSETYNDLWTASAEGLEFQHFPLYYQLNGFFVNKTGVFTVKIEFKLLRSLRLGAIISGTTLFLTIGLLVFTEYKIRKRSRIKNEA